ncbi:MAG TPA: carbohydrate kinase [Agromyces sp.]|nr:carbohydrate kinase [Agromyces sp.]
MSSFAEHSGSLLDERELDAVDVLVVGEALVDIVHSVDGEHEHPGGSPANVALGLGRLGITAALLSDLGRDPRGTSIADHLARSSVRVLAESFSDAPTSTATALIGADGAATYEFDVRWALRCEAMPVPARVVHTGSIAMFLEPGATAVEALLRSRPAGVLVSLDPNIRPALVGDRDVARAAFERFVTIADIVKLSDEDAAWLYPGDPVEAVLGRLLDAGVGLAAMTRGEAGAILATRKHVASTAALPVDVRDTVGAGDSFMAALLAELLRVPRPVDELDGADLERLAALAVAAAAVTVGRVGADLPVAADIERMRRTAAIERCTTGAIGTVVI